MAKVATEALAVAAEEQGILILAMVKAVDLAAEAALEANHLR